MDPYSQQYSFQTLLNSQQPNPYQSATQGEPSIGVSASDASVFCSPWTEDAEAIPDRKERHKWTPIEDGVLISAWLNTSKDAVVSNEQKGIAFWTRIADYYAASPKLAGFEKRDPAKCKSRWGKINEAVCKFVGSYTAATKQLGSGQSENKVMTLAHEIYSQDYKGKFTMEHAWLELRHDQKWCGASTTTDKVHSKRRKLDDHSTQSASSVAGSHGENEARPVGVKAAKAKAKKPVSKNSGEDSELLGIWEIRERDYAEKDKQNKQKLLDSLLIKKEPLCELEMALKLKLLKEML